MTKQLHVASNDQFVYAHSPFMALAFDKSVPRLAYLGVESGGRDRRHHDNNLLRPGKAGTLMYRGNPVTDARGTFTQNDQTLTYQDVPLGDDVMVNATIDLVDARTFRLHLKATRGQLQGDVFRLAFAPNVTPPNFWAQPHEWGKLSQPHGKGEFDPQPQRRAFNLPGLISLPDFGLLKIESATPGLSVMQALVPDLTNAGLNLGLRNTGHHNMRLAHHLGSMEIIIQAQQPMTELTLTFTVPPEIVPDLPGVDLSDAKWAGLKRGWMNHFTLNPPTLSLGDNYVLNGLGHLAIHWKSDVAVYTPEFLPGLPVQAFFRNALDLTFKHHTDERGKMTGYGWENGACNLIALHAYLLGSGDWDFARQHLPTLRNVVAYNLALDRDGDGILEASYHGNTFKDEKTSLNWWDAFGFGHKDAYGNLVYFQAFRRARDIFAGLNQDDVVSQIDTFLARFHAAFHKTFYNEKTGVYAGWISRDGNVHDYHFTFITAMAINEGLVPEDVAPKAMQTLVEVLTDNGYGEFTYGVPGPASPVDLADRTDWAPMADWGRYENGGFCGQTAYHFILALYKVGNRALADRILFNMMDLFEKGPTQNGLTPGFCKSYDWRTRDGQPCGYNYLADNYLYLLAAIQGHFGVPLPDLKLP